MLVRSGRLFGKAGRSRERPSAFAGLLASSWPVAIVVFSPFLAKRVFPVLSYSLIVPVLLLLVLGWRSAFHAGEALWTRSVTAKLVRTVK